MISKEHRFLIEYIYRHSLTPLNKHLGRPVGGRRGKMTMLLFLKVSNFFYLSVPLFINEDLMTFTNSLILTAPISQYQASDSNRRRNKKQV